ncbi:MAG: hypothetical protein ACR2P6_01315, partial [Gammaproteobacteria bacterium]
MTASGQRQRLNNWLLVLMLVIAFALRFTIAQDNFWLDEIWSYYMVSTLYTPFEVFTELKIDNNHPLNSLFMYAMGEQPAWQVYRLLALVCGVATVWYTGQASRVTGGKLWLGLLLSMLSLPLIQYSAEARGYGPAALCGLLAYYIYFSRRLNQPLGLTAMQFWLVCIAGFLSHLSFTFVFICIGFAWLIDGLRNKEPNSPLFRQGLILFLLPSVCMLWILIAFYMQLSSGGTHHSISVGDQLMTLMSYVAGTPLSAAGGVVAVMVCAALAIIGINSLD